MTALHERLQDVIAEMRAVCPHEERFGDQLHEWADRLVAATALQSSGGEVVAETMISHAREPHCIGCYVIRWNDGELVAQCNECGATVALLDGLASPAQPSGFVLVPVEPTEEFRRIFGFMGLSGFSACYAEMLTAAQSAPSPSAALQAGEVK